MDTKVCFHANASIHRKCNRLEMCWASIMLLRALRLVLGYTTLSHRFAVLLWWTPKGFGTNLEDKSEETSENQGPSPPTVLWAKLVNKRERALFSYFLWQKISYSTQTDTNQQAALHQGRDNAFRREAGCRSVRRCGTKAINCFKFLRLGKGLWLHCITLKVKLAEAMCVTQMCRGTE